MRRKTPPFSHPCSLRLPVPPHNCLLPSSVTAHGMGLTPLPRQEDPHAAAARPAAIRLAPFLALIQDKLYGWPAVQLTVFCQGFALPETTLTPDQCRAGRALLGISQERLCKMAGVSRAPLADFEGGKTKPYAGTLEKFKNALEAAGVVFVESNGMGPGVRLRETGKNSV